MLKNRRLFIFCECFLLTDAQTRYFCKLLLSGKHVQGTTITDYLALQAPLERELTAVR